MSKIFFENWQSLERTFVITLVAYIALILLLRISGKRTLSKMNAFDFVITVALGSSFATVALSKSVPLADGVLAIALLIGMQFVITWLSVRSKTVKNFITSQPTLLLYQGEILHNIVKKERITMAEIEVAVRNKGIGNIKDVAAIVLETTGDLTVIENLTDQKASSLSNVKHYNG